MTRGKTEYIKTICAGLSLQVRGRNALPHLNQPFNNTVNLAGRGCKQQNSNSESSPVSAKNGSILLWRANKRAFRSLARSTMLHFHHPKNCSDLNVSVNYWWWKHLPFKKTNCDWTEMVLTLSWGFSHVSKAQGHVTNWLTSQNDTLCSDEGGDQREKHNHQSWRQTHANKLKPT